MSVYPQFRTLGDIARFHSVGFADRTAMICRGRETTYRELEQAANQVGRGLRDLVQPQQRVAVLAKNSDAYFELLMGCSHCGAVLVGVNWRLAAPEIEYILRDSRSRVLFVDESFLPLIEDLRERLPLLQRVIVFSDSGGYRAWRDNCSNTELESSTSGDDIALQLYTSGTTGRPKGVQLSHRSILYLRSAEHHIAPWSQWDCHEVALVAMPQFHIGGTATGLIALYNGATAVIVTEVNPAEILELIPRYRVSRTFLVPAAIKLLLDHPDCRPEVFESLKILLYGASPIPAALLRRALEVMNCGFAQIYGMTETSGSMTVLQPDDHADPEARKMSSCGRPYPGVKIAIADETGAHLPVDTVGEIMISAPCLMSGYWGREEATREALRDGWLRSGDAGFLDEEGYLYIHDRVKDMIVSGGENIYPAEVENALYGHPGIQDVAVIGVPSKKWGEEVKAVVVRSPGTDPAPEDIINYARERIAGFKSPRSVDFVDELPRNASGKLLKKDIRRPYWRDMDRQVN